VAGVGAGPNPLAAALANLQYGIGIPVMGTAWMVVNCHIDRVLVTKLSSMSKASSSGSETIVSMPCLGELKGLSALIEILGKTANSVVYQLDARVGQLLFDRLPRIGR